MAMTSTEEQKRAEPGTAEAPATDIADASGAPAEDTDSHGSVAQESGKGLGLVQLIGSAFAAALGVQSSKNRERDFRQGRAGIFIVVGLVFTALFIGAVYGVVSLVLSSR